MVTIRTFLNLLSTCLTLVSRTDSRVISTAQGRLRGITREGYVSYTGIPYGAVSEPTGRFKMSGVAPIWSGVRDSKSNLCSPVSIEDCLQLDVHVPTKTAVTWPVLVWVSGGSGPFNPSMLVQQGIILVIVHHRHGPLGFLWTGNENIPGNTGVKDVVSALRWVRDNIIAFKGNPNKVVIAGQGFGAAMVEALLLSTMAHGLYHGAILQSGSILCPWAFNYDARERLMKFLHMFDDTEDTSNILIRNKIDDLVEKANRLDASYFPFSICLEKPMKKEESLLTETPYDILTSKKLHYVPKITGFNNNEAYIFASFFKEVKISRMSGDRSQLLPNELKFLNKREKSQVTRQVEDMYFNNNWTMESILAYYRDVYFSSHIHRSVNLHVLASTAPTYYYQFSHVGNLGVQTEPGIKKIGAAHSDELSYLFNNEEFGGDDGQIQRRIIKLWTNFVKFLNPNSPGEDTIWQYTKPENHQLLDIGEELRMIEYPHSKTSKMWDEIYEKHYYRRHRVGNE